MQAVISTFATLFWNFRSPGVARLSQQQCSHSYKVLKVLSSLVGRRLARNLHGVEAKAMVDFLHQVCAPYLPKRKLVTYNRLLQLLCDHNYVEYRDKKRDILSLLSRLAQSSRVFPTQCKLAELAA
jgi:hypothetical protein